MANLIPSFDIGIINDVNVLKSMENFDHLHLFGSNSFIVGDIKVHSSRVMVKNIDVHGLGVMRVLELLYNTSR